MPLLPCKAAQWKVRLISGKPDTSRGVRPVWRGAFGNLPQQCGKALGAYPTCNTSRSPILVHLGKQVVELGFALFCLVQLCCLLFLACCPLLVAGSEKPLYQVLLVESRLSGPVLDPRQNIGVQNIIADIVHGALVQALTVFAAVVVAVRLLVLPVGTKCQGPAAVRAFH